MKDLPHQSLWTEMLLIKAGMGWGGDKKKSIKKPTNHISHTFKIESIVMGLPTQWAPRPHDFHGQAALSQTQG